MKNFVLICCSRPKVNALVLLKVFNQLTGLYPVHQTRNNWFPSFVNRQRRITLTQCQERRLCNLNGWLSTHTNIDRVFLSVCHSDNNNLFVYLPVHPYLGFGVGSGPPKGAVSSEVSNLLIKLMGKYNGKGHTFCHIIIFKSKLF